MDASGLIDSDCTVEVYHISLTSNPYTPTTELVVSGLNVIPDDIGLAKLYQFYVMA